jgi:hypothetical protein
MNTMSNRLLKISDIVIDRSIQPRANGLDEDHVLDLVAAYDRGEPVPPPVVWNIGGVWKASQGYHRLEAQIRRGVVSLECEVRTGTEIDCAIDALTSNREHLGLKRTNADKRRAVDRLLELCPGWTDRRIAEKAGVSDPFVAERRSLVLTVSTSEPQKRVGKDGRNITVKPKSGAKKGRTASSKGETKAPEPETKAPETETPAVSAEPQPATNSPPATPQREPKPEPPPPTAAPIAAPIAAPTAPIIPAGRTACPHCGGCGHVPVVTLLHTAAGMPPIPASLDTPAFRVAWEDWLCERRARKKTVTARAAKLQLASLERLTVAQAIECITKSIQSGWAGLFPEQIYGTRNTGQRSGRDRNPSRVEGAPGDFDGLGGPDYIAE